MRMLSLHSSSIHGPDSDPLETVMESLHAPCTPLKKAYDACFNHWFEEYLAVAAPKPGSQPQSTLPLSSATPQASTSAGTSLQSSIAVAAEGLSHENVNPTEAEARQAKIRAKAEEYEKKCGDTWRAYRTCLEVGSKHITSPLLHSTDAANSMIQTGLHEKDLKQLIREAREEFPLKQPKEINMDP